MAPPLIESGSKAIASYNYTDLEDGSGTVPYYSFQSSDTSGDTYHLAKDNPYGVKSHLLTTTNPTEWNFNTGAFNTPRVINGTLSLNFMTHVTDGGALTQPVRMTIKLYRVRSAAETQIGSTWVSQNLTIGDVTPLLAKIPIVNAKFRRNDSLRFEFTASWASGIATFEFGIDPQNRDGSNILPATNASHFTTNIAQIPFRIDD
jgi:hypothetical protein